MPLALYPKCWRGRDDCMPIHCIDGVDKPLTIKQMQELDYTPTSFVCSGCVNPESRVIPQDLYRLCFKTQATDSMTDNDLQDLSTLINVASAALSLDAVKKHANGVVEIPAEHTKPSNGDDSEEHL